MKSLDLVGKRFGELAVLRTIPVGRDRGWLCLCDCGNQVSIVTGSLTSGKTMSCGCRRRRVNRERSITHGLTGHPLLSVYKNMIQRCSNPNTRYYKNYGGRGISVCQLWLDNFEDFYKFAVQNGWQHELTIDRINNDGDYEPDNCRFVTKAENNRNRNGVQTNNTTGVRGVSYSKANKKYVAYARGKHLGYFSTVSAAAAARDEFNLVKVNMMPWEEMGL